MRVDVVADAVDDDSGFVGEWLRDRYRADLVLRDRDRIRAGDSCDADLVVLLGSERSVCAADQAPVVAAEADFVRSALDAGVPVMGICYGGQLLAHALGGSVAAADQPEIGRHLLTSYDSDLCPPGPWTQFHSDAFTPPPGARVLGMSAAGCQGFADTSRAARALGWQFHPEVTPQRFITWVERLRGYCERHGADPDALIAGARDDEAALRRRAHTLTDAAMSWLRAGSPEPAVAKPGELADRGGHDG